MTLHYKKAMEQVSLSPETADNIRQNIQKSIQENVQDTIRNDGQNTLPDTIRTDKDASHGSTAPKRLSPRRLAGMAAAICLAFGLISTGAASAYGYFYHRMPEEVAGSLQPVKLTHTSQDITMTVQYASVEDGTLAVYLTLEDISGEDRLAQGVDFYHSYEVNKPDGTAETIYKYRSLGYDEDSRTYGFLVEIIPSGESGNALYFQNQQYTLSVGQLLLAQLETEPLLQPDWSTLPANPDVCMRSCFVWGDINNYNRRIQTSNNMMQVLCSGSLELPIAEGFTVTAAGFLDDGFHVQVRYDNKDSLRDSGELTNFAQTHVIRNGSLHDSGELTLITSDGTTIGNVFPFHNSGRYCCVSFKDEAQYQYTEYIFDISPEELEGASLGGKFTSGGWLLDGDWEVTFSLEQSEESVEISTP